MRTHVVTIPPLSDEQRQLARHAATEARRRRAEVKQALRTGRRTLSEVLTQAEQDDVVAHTKVVDVLKSLPRVGAVRAARVMERLDIAPNRRLRGLGKHQTAALVAEFPAPGAAADSSA
ncbi:MAG: integration host factor [uncultured Friedmanniella sp.]|uniref:Integration host factor n=1 Tax=uncultured Friedmanniella sp. TaxID=335381 RepID=A0A6J4JYH6_9ACTN|nr:MAG: integration host factor [uncultured Friedmanniella sp.]